MAKDPITVVSDSYREVTITNIDSLGVRRVSLENEIRDIERAHTEAMQNRLAELNQGIDELRRLARREMDSMEATVVAQLAPLDAQLLDCVTTLHSQERVLHNLPKPAAPFPERRPVDAPAASTGSATAPEGETPAVDAA
jgi:hypothetical protein